MQALLNDLMQFINQEIMEGQGEDLQIDTPLLELGIIDSLSMVNLLTFIDRQYGIEIPADQALPEHFKDVESIAQLIKVKQNSVAG